MMSFLDAYSGHNQIQMYELDIPKTTFTTDTANYCYKVMPFGLKNAGETERLSRKLNTRHNREVMHKRIKQNINIIVIRPN